MGRTLFYTHWCTMTVLTHISRLYQHGSIALFFFFFWNQYDHIVETSPNGVSMSGDGCNEVRGVVGREGVLCGVMLLGCGDATWKDDQPITDNNAEIQKINLNRIQLSKKEIRRNKNKKPPKQTKLKKTKNHKLLSVSAPGGPALKWFASEVARGTF